LEGWDATSIYPKHQHAKTKFSKQYNTPKPNPPPMQKEMSTPSPHITPNIPTPHTYISATIIYLSIANSKYLLKRIDIVSPSNHLSFQNIVSSYFPPIYLPVETASYAFGASMAESWVLQFLGV
jgi:hypothetical protein